MAKNNLDYQTWVMRYVSMKFTRLLHFLHQNNKKRF